MEFSKARKIEHSGFGPEHLTEEITEFDHNAYKRLVSVEMTPEQQERILTPPRVHFDQDAVLAIHWHPEFVPMDLIKRRIAASFPNSDLELIIPTQHNRLNSYDGYAGVETDCYAKAFHRKVQFLVHFKDDNLTNADVFTNMLEHTFKYRSGQLDEYFDTLLDERYEDRLSEAAAFTGANEALVNFVRIGSRKLRKLVEIHYNETPKEMLRNKLIKNYFDSLGDIYDARYIGRAQIFLKTVKEIVKRQFPLSHFYEVNEFIEEIRSHGGGIVIPHPEQFWPILMADYDVDGYEVWNPQSREFTEFLINVVNRQNESPARKGKPLLITMGDDCHMGEKVKDPRFQEREKAAREIGVQPAWDDLSIRKSLIFAGVDRRKTITEYKGRLQ
jgi:hypothetical protein